MKAPRHTEEAVEHTTDQHNTGNHKRDGTLRAGQRRPDWRNARGAENVEPQSEPRPRPG